jgi:hypothetical protein
MVEEVVELKPELQVEPLGKAVDWTKGALRN